MGNSLLEGEVTAQRRGDAFGAVSEVLAVIGQLSSGEKKTRANEHRHDQSEKQYPAPRHFLFPHYRPS